MLYNEFLEGTGCKDNEHNYGVYKELEIIYMNSDCTKEHIYEMGKKLVDNSKSESELKLEAEIKAEIAAHKAEIETYKEYIEQDTYSMNYWKMCGDKEFYEQYKRNIKTWKLEIKKHKAQIAALKWVIA